MQVINGRGSTLCVGLTTSCSRDSKTYTLLTSVHNNTDNTDDTHDYNRVIGLAQLKAFSCAKNQTYDPIQQIYFQILGI